MRSIRGTLTVSILLGMVLLLLLAGALVEHLIRGELARDFDQALLEKAKVLLTFTEQEAGEVEFDFESDLLPEFHADEHPEYFEMRRLDGELVGRSTSMGDKQLPSLGDISATPRYADLILPDGREGRMVAFTFIPTIEDGLDDQEPGQPPGAAVTEPPAPIVTLRIAVARGKERLNDLLASIRTILLAALIATIAAVAIYISFSVRRGLRPLRAIVRQVKGLDSTKLQTRLDPGIESEEVTPIINQLNDLLERLDGAFQREKRFSGNVAHELRTPIAELRAVAEVGSKWPSDEKMVRGFFFDLLDLADDMERTVTNLLTLARLDAGQQDIALESVDLHDLITRTWKQFSQEADKKQVTLEVGMPRGMRVRTDKSKLVLILSNLFSNSVSYSPPGSSIVISARERESKIEISVSNLTVDLNEHDLPLMFERFWRKGHMQTDGHHAGLGLTLVKALSEMLNLKVRPQLDRQGRFTMTMYGLQAAL